MTGASKNLQRPLTKSHAARRRVSMSEDEEELMNQVGDTDNQYSSGQAILCLITTGQAARCHKFIIFIISPTTRLEKQAL